ncbi:MAG: hypothetical protein PWQ25_2208 [Deferribacteres bacterium]|nr:hypothetical protein [Deferribacteres bacterium]
MNNLAKTKAKVVIKMLTKKPMEQKETVKLYNKYGEYVGEAYMHIRKKREKECLIIESNKKINPAQYIENIFNFLKPFLTHNKNIHVYLDLSNYYGTNNSSWLYEWIFKTNNGQLIETDFVRIDKWSKITDREDAAMLNDYLFEKFETFQ